MKEEELASMVIEWIENKKWDVYQEVRVYGQWGKIIDIVAVKDNIYWAIECKTSLSLSVLEQAYNHCYVHQRSIAIPKVKRGSRSRLFAHDVAQKYDIGVLVVTENSVNEIIPAKLLKCDALIIKNALNDAQKHYRKAGSKDGKLWTPYRETMDMIKIILEGHPGLTVKEIMTHLDKHHYASDASAAGSIRYALKSFESDWCVCKRDGNRFLFYLKEFDNA